METVLSTLRQILGNPNFYQPNQTGYTWNYGAMIEYIVAGILVIVVVSYVFRFLLTVWKSIF